MKTFTELKKYVMDLDDDVRDMYSIDQEIVEIMDKENLDEVTAISKFIQRARKAGRKLRAKSAAAPAGDRERRLGNVGAFGGDSQPADEGRHGRAAKERYCTVPGVPAPGSISAESQHPAHKKINGASPQPPNHDWKPFNLI